MKANVYNIYRQGTKEEVKQAERPKRLPEVGARRCFFLSESMSEDGGSWIWQMMQKDIEQKSKPEKPQGTMQDGVRYECEHCEYKAKLKHRLTIHTQATQVLIGHSIGLRQF